MVLDRSVDGAAGRKKGPPSAKEQVVGQRLRSQAASATSQQKAASGSNPSKEKWVTKTTTQSKEFELTLGKPDFPRTTGSYTPGEQSPFWDPSGDIAAPFHRSTPSHELEDEVRCEDDILGVHSVTRPAVRLDISAGQGQQSRVMTVANPVTSSPALGASPKVTLQATSAAAAAIISTVASTRMNETNIISNPSTTSNPFGSAGAGGEQGAAGPGLSVTSRHLLNTTSAHSVVSPIPSPSAAASSFPTNAGGLEQKQDAAATAAAITKGQHLVQVINLEYGSIDVDSYTAELLHEMCLEAHAHKKSLARVEEKLLGVPEAVRHRQTFADTRAELVGFIRAAQRKVCESQSARANP